ncbi:MAG: double-strand break repair helicase AddA [Beijerinckiaceae bacterium]
MSRISENQRKAADPHNSVWVSANAGSGKTSVLTSRVVRLLLNGADPARILCVTFTKAAAANMQNRIFEKLGEWVAMDDASLAVAITDMDGAVPGPARLKVARRLFARAVETPGGLKIQTIHGFCERVLHLFPFEAAVPARFQVMEDVEQERMTEAAITATLRTALQDANAPMGKALVRATTDVGEGAFGEALRAFMRHRRNVAAPAYETKFAHTAVHSALDVAPGETEEAVTHDILNNGLYSLNWQEIAGWLEGGKDTDKKKAALLRKARQVQGEENIAQYLSIFLTAQEKPLKSLATKAIAEARPDLLEVMQDEQERVLKLNQKRKAALTAERTEAITLLADAVLELYRTEKRRMGRLDFPDLISKVVTLLSADSACWVLFKLDQGLDHVLVDEAQDTSPEQWAIVKALSDDFFAGENARPASARTIFAVGDEKQSIFGFQGARPEEFEKARRHFDQQIKAFNAESLKPHPFEKIALQTSYRTVGDVLTAVDQVFSQEQNFRGLDSNNERTVHESNRQGEPGLVELWPEIVGEKQGDVDPTAPVDSVLASAPAALLAERIATRIAHWTSTGARFEDDGKPISPGDILILVRNRGPIFDCVLKALKAKAVPVAGADRMKLNQQIAVLDLLALGRFVLLNEDDLTLAALLKSPLLGMSEDELLEVANGRGKTSLWAALQAKASNVRFAEMVRKLMHWQALAQRSDPFNFYSDVLSVGGGRRQLLARLGQDSAEAIDVFMARLRQWQASNPPSLLAFIEELSASDTDVKRDMEEAHGRVRVMTVHGSKGLEARIVILADVFNSSKGASKTPRLVELEEYKPDTAVWSVKGGDDPQSVKDAKERLDEVALAEHRRLLYVALTRARDRLYITGARGITKPPTDSWQLMIDAALQGHEKLVEVPDESGPDSVMQWRTTPKRAVPDFEAKATETAPEPPDWLHTPAPNDLPKPPPLRPSRLVDAAEAPASREQMTPQNEARQRGQLIHHLLQHVPGIEPERRESVANRLTKARYGGLGEETRAGAVKATLSLISDPRFATLFDQNARAEVDIAGKIEINGQTRDVAGRMDRLSVTATEVVLVDFKTGRPPKDITQVPGNHLQQLAVYHALLSDIYPDRTVTAAVIWTTLPDIVVLSDAQLKTALGNIKLQ